jgi:diguanylate cyclase (GGDEF)-like protein
LEQESKERGKTPVNRSQSPLEDFSDEVNDNLARANAAPEQGEPTPPPQTGWKSDGGECGTHYVAYWSEENLVILCGHQHTALSEAVACIQGADGSVKAVTDSQERTLTAEEKDDLCRSLVALYLRARELSRRDTKTGALNDRAFKELLSYEIKRSRRNVVPLTLVSLDLDGFKDINDNLGHPTGDLVLKVVTWTMQAALREIDSVARLGGDEFALLLPETSAEGARLVLDKLQNALKNAMKTYQWTVTFSVGVVTFKTPPTTAEYMIDMADKAMLLVKKTGKNRVSYLALD